MCMDLTSRIIQRLLAENSSLGYDANQRFGQVIDKLSRRSYADDATFKYILDELRDIRVPDNISIFPERWLIFFEPLNRRDPSASNRNAPNSSYVALRIEARRDSYYTNMPDDKRIKFDIGVYGEIGSRPFLEKWFAVLESMPFDEQLKGIDEMIRYLQSGLTELAGL